MILVWEGRVELMLDTTIECDLWNTKYNSSSVALGLSQSSSLLISGLRRVSVPKHLVLVFSPSGGEKILS